MPRVTRRPLVETDILEIWDYIAADSVEQPDRWIDKLDQSLHLWATQPMMGRERKELASGLHSLPFGRYVVFFVPLEDGIGVVRVMHGSRDIAALSPVGETTGSDQRLFSARAITAQTAIYFEATKAPMCPATASGCSCTTQCVAPGMGCTVSFGT
ncbi:type II toxin-antitoxin system RelE/ParE family toxin [Ottowia sp.]|mgnify:CR=1 FL=1|uniref:type II toxin-antitoxin system RelE/ParE family toxin n=1 Tax=Ottowia sp. TaxID=1898956 RepID=UPI002B7DA722|nr:type II toxin-antitoxin system RelE/ParE family toxin [Ottowia sp.]